MKENYWDKKERELLKAIVLDEKTGTFFFDKSSTHTILKQIALDQRDACIEALRNSNNYIDETRRNGIVETVRNAEIGEKI